MESTSPKSIAELAREEGISRQAMHQRFKRSQQNAPRQAHYDEMRRIREDAIELAKTTRMSWGEIVKKLDYKGCPRKLQKAIRQTAYHRKIKLMPHRRRDIKSKQGDFSKKE
ncbi:MAG: hypothetical protein OXD01_05075 [Gammaproteobacteria bacterium]|nr:hypothetical protein [Gammaproteobacteria bacterium]